MKFRSRFTILTLTVILTGTSYLAWAQHQHQGHAASEQSAASQPSEHSMHEGGMMHSEMMHGDAMEHGKMANEEDMKAMMQEMGMSSGMMQRHQLLMQSKIAAADPQALLAMSQDFELTEEQIAQLEEIVEEAREKARDVLNKEQQNQLEVIPETPANMQGMMMQMHEKMQQMHGDQANKSSMMMCPMMQMMPGKSNGEESVGHEANH